MNENYISILQQSLEKKLQVLQDISKENARQKEILLAEQFNMDDFQGTIDRKDQLIGEIQFLDQGFDQTYQRVGNLLKESRETYRQEILKLQELISKITDCTVVIQREEQENRQLAVKQFGSEHKKLRQVRNSQSVTKQYYNNMAKMNFVDPQFMDKKK